MKRVLLIILLHLSLFFIVFAYHAQADDEEWYVNDFGTFVVAAVSGEVVHGDKLRFFIKKEDCSKVAMMFSFSTSLKKNRQTTREYKFECDISKKFSPKKIDMEDLKCMNKRRRVE